MSPTSPRRRLAGSVAALLVGAAAGVGLLAPAPAHAAACSGASGVTVVVDFAELGEGVTAGCAPDGGRARGLFTAAGYTLTTATKAPSFVCRVNGLPASDPCVDAAPPDAYWSLWWADGKGGSWVYASLGVDALKIPDGAYLAFSWHQGSGKAQPPSTVPVSRTEPTKKPAPSRKPAPKPAPTKKGGGSTSGPAPTAAPTNVPGAPDATASGTPTASASASPTNSASPSADEPTPGRPSRSTPTSQPTRSRPAPRTP
ncbi:hypothetical protein [Nocardioides daphniae]|uniref:DUF4430 domain-containing protein n=1 Tax=Nocardioides daphniae TaxID=402297 RepID=A0A4P7UAY2_9ACTN|nr:hypothetical protein [Nocardioides daphniae]QCC76844.1 hypothetical protein E2C04_05735 [Nocardioides daphniae]